MKRNDINFCLNMAKNNGGLFLSEFYISARTKYKWQCQMKHVFEAEASNIYQDHWCPYCAKVSSPTLKDLELTSNKRGGRLLSKIYVNNNSKLEWQCENGHRWFSNWNNIKNGKWCPKCTKQVSKQEIELYNLIKKYFPDALNSKRGLLKNKRFELDIYIPSLKKAIEFDGEYWHSQNENIERDTRKNKECEELGIKLLRVNYKNYITNIDLVNKKVLNFLET